MKELMSLMLIFSLNASVSFASDSPAIGYDDLTTLAKAAMTEEVGNINAHLAQHDFNIPAYNAKHVAFLQTMGKTQVAPGFLFNKCIMSEKAIGAVLNTVLTADNDIVGPEISSLAVVKSEFNKTVFELTTEMCKQSMKRFTARLAAATSQGQPLNLSTDTVTKLANITFFPFTYGRPSLTKTLRRDFSFVLAGGFLVGGVMSLVAAPSALVVISISSVASNSFALGDGLPKPQNELRKLDFTLLGSNGLHKLDLTQAEQNLN